MRKTILITMIVCFLLGAMAMPSHALSLRAEDFLKACRAVDAPFPPVNWEKSDLRSAALEVLNAVENRTYDKWPVDFCLKTLGQTQYPEDVDRILAYEDDMIYSVLASLKGFPSKKAIECQLRWIKDSKAPKRELAFKGLAAIDFRKMDDPEKWKNYVVAELRKARQKEKVNWLKDDMDVALTKAEVAPISQRK